MSWPGLNEIWGQGHFEAMSWTCPMSCPVSSNFFQAGPGHFQLRSGHQKIEQHMEVCNVLSMYFKF